MSRASNQKINAELFSLEPTALLEFFVIYYDYVNKPDDKLYVHGGTNNINGSVYWQGVEYLPFPIQSSGFESKGDGSLPRPKLTISNQDFFVSNLIRRYNNLVGAKVVRKRTFVKFLDNQNFSESKNPYGSADATAGLEDQVFFILRRASENRAIVEFELASPLELDNVTFPKRSVMARYCGFHYRGNGCKYMGVPVADENNMRLRKALDFRSGLIRRYYTGMSGTVPANNAALTSTIAATAGSVTESIVSTPTINSTIPTANEYVGYFKVDVDEAGVYEFKVICEGTNSVGEIFINGSVVANFFSNASTTFTIPLSAGYQRLLVRHYTNSSSPSPSLTLQYKIPPVATSSFASIPSSRFYYDPSEQNTLTSSQRFYTSSQLFSWVNLNNDALNDGLNRGGWQNGAVYKTGEYVYIENHNIKIAKKDINAIPNWSPLLKFYICSKAHTATGSKHPAFNKEYWVGDQCSKTVDGCKLRFGNESYLPFGGFPGTEEYSISSQ
jgi:lambda family phage minor tail protein L